MYRSANVQKEVCGVELAEAAGKIAKQRNISFGEALFIAREQMADIVTKSPSSPLRDEEAAVILTPSQVREAVVAGLQSVAPLWRPTSDAWIATAGASAIKDAASAVAAKLDAMGLGDQAISALTAELSTFLTGLVLKQPTSAKLSDLISQAADHAQQVYTQALANKLPTQVWTEAVRMSDESRMAVDVSSIVLRDNALRISKQRGISFGDALRIARTRTVTLADDVADASAIRQAVEGAMRGVLNKALSGKQQKVIGSEEVFQAGNAISDALKQLNIGNVKDVTDAATSCLSDVLSDNGDGMMSAANMDSLVSQAGDRATAAYSQYLKSLS